ncbi:MAG: hypothetical protein KDN19_03155 [Verrucomicrobiae bacterium]|nr:hypothetical protein [Verrucomicrobiae bacterium]
MKRSLFGRLIPLVLAIAMGAAVAENKRLQNILFEQEVLRENVRKSAEEDRTGILMKYAGAVERLQKDFQQKGDLENVLKARNEIQLTQEKKQAGTSEFPGISRLRETLASAIETIDTTEAQTFAVLDGKLVAMLEPLQKELTTQGKLEEALEVKKQIDAANERLNGGSNSLPLTRIGSVVSGTRKLDLVDKEFENSLLHSTALFTGDETLEPGRYHDFTKFELGDHSIEDRDEKTGVLTIPDGCEIYQGAIFGNVAKLAFSGSFFHDLQLGQNLHSDLTADTCVFDHCLFRKEGGWFARVSSRWIFNNCLISGSFFSDWRKGLVGVQARETTFEGIDFPSFGFKEDAGKEVIDDWWVYERCVFRNCRIPESLLIGLTDCVLEDCTLVPETLAIATPVKVTLYFRGREPEPPAPQANVEYELRPESRLTKKQTGTDIAYGLNGDRAEPLR